MKFCTFSHPARGSMRPGVLTADGAMIVDLGDSFPDILSIIKGGDEARTQVRTLLDRAEIRVPLGDAKLHAPVPVPEQIRDSMLFEKHVQQAMEQIARIRKPLLGPLMIRFGMIKVAPTWYQIPIYYKSNRFSVNGTDNDVIWPRYSQLMDFELEFGFSLARAARTSRPRKPGNISSVSPSSMTFLPAMPRVSKCRACLAPARARISIPATAWVRS